jgi:hypothetical protein
MAIANCLKQLTIVAAGPLRWSMIAVGASDGRDKRSTEYASILSQDKATSEVSSEDHQLRVAQKISKYHAGGMGTATAKDYFAMSALLLHR